MMLLASMTTLEPGYSPHTVKNKDVQNGKRGDHERNNEKSERSGIRSEN